MVEKNGYKGYVFDVQLNIGAARMDITPPHAVSHANLTEYTNSTEFFSDLCVTGETGHLPEILPTAVAACLSIYDELYYSDICLGEGGCRFFVWQHQKNKMRRDVNEMNMDLLGENNNTTCKMY